jgi:hypothetical protein
MWMGRMRVVLATMWTSSYRFVVVVVVVLVLRIQGPFIVSPVVATRRRILVVLSVVGVVLCFLARLLALAPLHPGLFQQPPLLCQTFALLSVLDLVLPDQGHGRMAEDVLVLAEFAYPGLAWGVVEVGVLLLNATLAGGILVEF